MMDPIALIVQSCTSSITSFLGAPSMVWFPIVTIAVVLILTVLGLVYVLGPLIGRNELSTWARGKAYDEVIAIVLIVMFLAFSAALCTVQPASAYQSMGLLPTECAQGAMVNNQTVPNSFYGIASCEIFTFNQNLFTFGNALFALGAIVSLSPVISVGSVQGTGPEGTLVGKGISDSIQFVPVYPVHTYIIPALDAVFALVIASQILQIIIVASSFLFSILMVIGLMARAFGITKTFGGAMIALAMGVGFVYPLMTTITYGFLNVAVDKVPSTTLPGIGTLPPLGQLLTYWLSGSVLANFVTHLVSAESCTQGSSVCFAQVLGVFLQPLGGIMLYVGIIFLGIALIPFMNLIIVDTFVIDFSRTIGERIDFLSLLTRIL